MIQAKFRCSTVTDIVYDEWDHEAKKHTGRKVKGSEQVSLHAVYASSESDPNKSWAKATPSGSLLMSIDNPAAWGAFKPDHEYILTFEEVPKATNG